MSTPLTQLPSDPEKNSDDEELMKRLMKEVDDSENVPQPAQPTYDQEQYPPEHFHNQTQYEDDGGYQITPEPKLSLMQTIIREARVPVIIACLFVAANLPVLDKMLAKSLPKIANDAGSLNMIGITLKALAVTLIFYIITKLTAVKA